MAVQDELRELREALDELTRVLGFPQVSTGWLPQEGVAGLSFGKTLDGALETIQQSDLDRWFDRFQDALKLTFDLPEEEGGPEARQETLTSARHLRTDLSQISAEAVKYGRPIEVTVTITKSVLEKRLSASLAQEGSLRVIPFFFAARLKTILSGMHVLSFERDFLIDEDGKPHQRLLLLAADAGGHLQGPFLAIVGNDQGGQAEDFARAGAPLWELSAARELMSEKCNWIGDRPEILTPDFFLLNPGDLEGCRGELIRLRNQLSLPFLADRTTASAAGLESVFEGTRSVKIPAGEERQSEFPFRLYRWAYLDPKSGETRLEIVRRVLSSRLTSGSGGFATLVQSGPELLSECAVQLRVLIDRNLTDSFERRERVDKLVRDYADETRKQIASLARELANDAYKTAGLLLGVVIAYLLQPDQGPAVLILSGIFYAAYLLFVRFFYLPTLGREHEARQKAFGKREKEIRRSGILTRESEEALGSVREDDALLTARHTKVSKLYVILAVAPLALLLGWLMTGWWRTTPEGVRHQALSEQARRFEALGFGNVRLEVADNARTAPLTGTGGRTAYPDLTAQKRDSTLVAVAWVPCSRIGRADELARLRLLEELARQNRVEVQLLTEPVCQKEMGPRRLRTWLQRGGLPDLEIWTG